VRLTNPCKSAKRMLDLKYIDGTGHRTCWPGATHIGSARSTHASQPAGAGTPAAGQASECWAGRPAGLPAHLGFGALEVQQRAVVRTGRVQVRHVVPQEAL
jgi:hypothetical protein